VDPVVDTNVLVFDTFEGSEYHNEASSKLDSMDRWHLPSIVLHEPIWFFKVRKIQLSRARLKVEEYSTNEKTSLSQCTADDIRFASARMRNYQEYDDLVFLSVAKRLSLPLYTFDSELKQVAIRNSVRSVK